MIEDWKGNLASNRVKQSVFLSRKKRKYEITKEEGFWSFAVFFDLSRFRDKKTNELLFLKLPF
jgi:hypothetical protein